MPEDIHLPDTTSYATSARKMYSIFAAAILAIIAGFAYFYFQLSPDTAQRWVPDTPIEIVNARRSGNLEEALRLRDEIRSTETTKERRALADINVWNVEFKMTGDINDKIEALNDLKEVFWDPEVDVRVRVMALNQMSSAFCGSGRDPAVFEAIYQERPFSKYLAPGDPDLSAKNLAEYSLSLYPTSYAAIRVVRWYSEQILDKSLATSTREQYLEESKKYLTLADELIQKEISDEPEIVDSTCYIIYRYWRAMTLARLARAVGAPYDAQYREAFDSLIADLQNRKQDVLAYEYNFYSLLFAAQHTNAIEEDQEISREYLARLAVELDDVDSPARTRFARFLINLHTYEIDGKLWRNVQRMAKISPEFDAAVDRIISVGI